MKLRRLLVESIAVFGAAIALTSCGDSENTSTESKTENTQTASVSETTPSTSASKEKTETASVTEEKKEEHVHTYNVKNVDAKYLAKEATEEAAATYYYSCSCGEKGTETFTPDYAKPLDPAHVHSYTVKNIAEEYVAAKATCTTTVSYYYSCSCGEKGTETFTPDYAKASGHEIDVTGKCTHEGCDLNYGYDVTSLTSSFTVTGHDGYIYVHYPMECMWNHAHLSFNNFQATDYQIYLGNDLENAVTSEFISSSGHLYATKFYYNTDIYFKIGIGNNTSLTIDPSISTVNTTHQYPSMANLSYKDGSFYKKCVLCNSEITEMVTPVEITTDKTTLTLAGVTERRNDTTAGFYVYKLHTDSMKYVFVDTEANYHFATVNNGNVSTNDNHFVNGDVYLIVDCTSSVAKNYKTVITFKDIEDMPTDNIINPSEPGIYKVSTPNGCYVGSFSTDGVTCTMYDASNYNVVAASDTVTGDYMYIAVDEADEVTSTTFSFAEHTHSYTNHYCSCGQCDCEYLYGEDVTDTVPMGVYCFCVSYASTRNVTVTSLNDENMAIEIRDGSGSDSNVLASGTGTLTYTSSDTFYVFVTNTTAHNQVSVVYSAA